MHFTETVSQQIARVTSWQDCIVLGCQLEDGHEGPHEFRTYDGESDARYSLDGCPCGDAFCAGCREEES